ncbi:MAG: lipid A biosynthesis lauroyl acyltransferase [Actinomycetia bacterium]|nr:lipid A biosynthesis lauroyl acyltransferase [Actinomycetes bacterium]
MRQLKFLWKAFNSGTAGCPALYRSGDGYVVQGIKLDTQTRAALRQLADNEDGVWVPADVIDRIKDLA